MTSVDILGVYEIINAHSSIYALCLLRGKNDAIKFYLINSGQVNAIAVQINVEFACVISVWIKTTATIWYHLIHILVEYICIIAYSIQIGIRFSHEF